MIPRLFCRTRMINSLAPGRSECDSKNGIFDLVALIGIFRSSHDNALQWMPEDLTDDKSALVQVMAWCRQATSHYLSQCWLSLLSPYGVARPHVICLLFERSWTGVIKSTAILTIPSSTQIGIIRVTSFFAWMSCYLVFSRYCSRVYHGIGYILIACWKPIFCFAHPFSNFCRHAVPKSEIFSAKSL